jgi:hypothetical protein
MPVDRIALYLKLYAHCEQSPNGVYTCDTARFYQDTGFMTFNVLSPLIANGSIGVRTPDDGRNYHITIKEAVMGKPSKGTSPDLRLKENNKNAGKKRSAPVATKIKKALSPKNKP